MPRLIEASKVQRTTVNLCEPSGTDIIYTIRTPHEKAYFRATLPGRRMPMFCTAPGLTILANRSEEECEAVLAASDMTPITEWTVHRPEGGPQTHRSGAPRRLLRERPAVLAP